MSVKRPGRRYIGFRYRPGSASRKDVGRAIEAAWADGAPEGAPERPRLLVCDGGSAILVIPTPGARAMRAALGRDRPAGGLKMEPVVTSGTITTVKQRLGLERRRGR